MGGGELMVGVTGSSRPMVPSDVELVDHPLVVFCSLRRIGGGSDSSGDLTRFLESVDIMVGWNVVTRVESFVVVVVVVVVVVEGTAEYNSK